MDNTFGLVWDKLFQLFLQHTHALILLVGHCYHYVQQLWCKQEVGSKAKNQNFYIPTLAIRKVNEKPQFQQPLFNLLFTILHLL